MFLREYKGLSYYINQSKIHIFPYFSNTFIHLDFFNILSAVALTRTTLESNGNAFFTPREKVVPTLNCRQSSAPHTKKI